MSETNKTIEMRAGEELDVGVIDAVIKDNIDGLSGMPEIRQFESGHSNLTYFLGYPEKRLVLRRPPHGTKPKSGHSMIREYTVMKHLKPSYPAVPKTYFHLDDEHSPLGAEFYVMDCVPGRKLERDIPASWNFGEAEGRKLCLAFFDKLIELHKVDYKAVGLGDFGKPDGYIKRQILGWNGRYERALTDDVEPFEDVRAWLEEKMPDREVGASIIHGDFRLDNCILDEDNPFNVRAVLDWEISALGDPLMDLGNTLAYWIQGSDSEQVRAFRMQPCNAPGMLTREEILDYYAEHTGHDISHFDFYHVYGIFRLAAILQQIYYRYYHGQTQNKTFASFGKRANLLGGYCRYLIENSTL